MTEVIKFLTSGTWQANTTIAIVFLLAMTAAMIFLAAFLQGRDVSFWGFKIGARPRSDNSAMSQHALIAKGYARITKPDRGQKVPWSFAVEGTFRDLPEGYELWIFTTAGSGLSSRYWPQARAATRDDNGTWRSNVYGIGGDTGAIRTFGIFLVGHDGQVLIEFWKAAGQSVAAGAPWLPLTRLTQDIYKYHEVDVVVESGKPQQTA